MRFAFEESYARARSFWRLVVLYSLHTTKFGFSQGLPSPRSALSERVIISHRQRSARSRAAEISVKAHTVTASLTHARTHARSHTHTHTHTRKRYGVRDDLYDKNDIVCLRVDIEAFEPLHVDGGERDRALLSLCATHARTRRQDEDPHTLKELGYHRPGNSRPAAGGTGPADL